MVQLKQPSNCMWTVFYRSNSTLIFIFCILVYSAPVLVGEVIEENLRLRGNVIMRSSSRPIQPRERFWASFIRPTDISSIKILSETGIGATSSTGIAYIDSFADASCSSSAYYSSEGYLTNSCVNYYDSQLGAYKSAHITCSNNDENILITTYLQNDCQSQNQANIITYAPLNRCLRQAPNSQVNDTTLQARRYSCKSNMNTLLWRANVPWFSYTGYADSHCTQPISFHAYRENMCMNISRTQSRSYAYPTVTTAPHSCATASSNSPSTTSSSSITYNASHCITSPGGVSDGSGRSIMGSSYRVSLITNGHAYGMTGNTDKKGFSFTVQQILSHISYSEYETHLLSIQSILRKTLRHLLPLLTTTTSDITFLPSSTAASWNDPLAVYLAYTLTISDYTTISGFDNIDACYENITTTLQDSISTQLFTSIFHQTNFLTNNLTLLSTATASCEVNITDWSYAQTTTNPVSGNTNNENIQSINYLPYLFTVFAVGAMVTMCCTYWDYRRRRPISVGVIGIDEAPPPSPVRMMNGQQNELTSATLAMIDGQETTGLMMMMSAGMSPHLHHQYKRIPVEMMGQGQGPVPTVVIQQQHPVVVIQDEFLLQRILRVNSREEENSSRRMLVAANTNTTNTTSMNTTSMNSASSTSGGGITGAGGISGTGGISGAGGGNRYTPRTGPSGGLARSGGVGTVGIEGIAGGRIVGLQPEDEGILRFSVG